MMVDDGDGGVVDSDSGEIPMRMHTQNMSSHCCMHLMERVCTNMLRIDDDDDVVVHNDDSDVIGEDEIDDDGVGGDGDGGGGDDDGGGGGGDDDGGGWRW
jgi:uncharacterized membrane protein YgcG